jgi:hypothetical protein
MDVDRQNLHERRTPSLNFTLNQNRAALRSEPERTANPKSNNQTVSAETL